MDQTPTTTARPSDPLTARQARTLLAICTFRDERGYAPSLAELARGTGVSESRCRIIVGALERRGWIARDRSDGRSLSRAIVVLHRPEVAGA